VKTKHFVRQSLFFALTGMGTATCGFAQNLPPIDAHRFQSSPVQISTSGRVYRFSTKSADVPRVGNIVLIQEDGKPSMAFRVMQSNPQKKEYVGRRVRRYDNHQRLVINRSYGSVEKIADKINAPDAQPEPETVMAV